jgi:VanZ family protein
MFFKYNALTIIWWVIMSVLIFLPGNQLPETNDWDFLMLDKLAHFGLFAIFAFLLIRGLNKQYQFLSLRRHSLIYSLAFGIFYAVSAEFLQQYASDRHFEWQDMIANALGILTGLLIYLVFVKKLM